MAAGNATGILALGANLASVYVQGDVAALSKDEVAIGVEAQSELGSTIFVIGNVTAIGVAGATAVYEKTLSADYASNVIVGGNGPGVQSSDGAATWRSSPPLHPASAGAATSTSLLAITSSPWAKPALPASTPMRVPAIRTIAIGGAVVAQIHERRRRRREELLLLQRQRFGRLGLRGLDQRKCDRNQQFGLRQRHNDRRRQCGRVDALGGYATGIEFDRDRQKLQPKP